MAINSLHRATKWLDLNNRGCLTHGCRKYETSATKWLNNKKDIQPTLGLILSILPIPWVLPTVIEILPLSG